MLHPLLIPEIIRHVLLQLVRGDSLGHNRRCWNSTLLACVVVNKIWHLAGYGLLWSELHIANFRCLELILHDDKKRKNPTERRVEFLRHATFVRVIECSGPLPHELLLIMGYCCELVQKRPQEVFHRLRTFTSRQPMTQISQLDLFFNYLTPTITAIEILVWPRGTYTPFNQFMLAIYAAVFQTCPLLAEFIVKSLTGFEMDMTFTNDWHLLPPTLLHSSSLLGSVSIPSSLVDEELIVALGSLPLLTVVQFCENKGFCLYESASNSYELALFDNQSPMITEGNVFDLTSNTLFLPTTDFQLSGSGTALESLVRALRGDNLSRLTLHVLHFPDSEYRQPFISNRFSRLTHVDISHTTLLDESQSFRLSFADLGPFSHLHQMLSFNIKSPRNIDLSNSELIRLTANWYGLARLSLVYEIYHPDDAPRLTFDLIPTLLHSFPALIQLSLSFSHTLEPIDPMAASVQPRQLTLPLRYSFMHCQRKVTTDVQESIAAYLACQLHPQSRIEDFSASDCLRGDPDVLESKMDALHDTQERLAFCINQKVRQAWGIH